MIRAGVIGVGVHGLNHARLLSRMEGVRLAGVYDINPAVCESVAAEFDVRAFPTARGLLEEVDGVIVAAPTSAHHEVVMECLSRGKPVLVEKPIAAAMIEADEMIGEAGKQGVTLAVGHLERFNSAYRSLSTFPLAPMFVESHRLSVFNPRGTDVAVVLDLMIHDIDILLDLVKLPVSSVRAVGIPVVSNGADIANARIEFTGGCVANLTASRISQKKMRKLRLFQKNAYVSMDFLAGESEIFSLDPGIRPEPQPNEPPRFMEGISYRKTANDGLNALELELADFIRAVRDGSAPRVTGYDGRRALDVAVQVMESVASSLRMLE
jgi:predicted dehydrogenase